MLLFEKLNKLKLLLSNLISNNIKMIQQEILQYREPTETLTIEQTLRLRIKNAADENKSIGYWIQLLKNLQKNHMYEIKDQAINIMHQKFILNQDFWAREIKRKIQSVKQIKQEDVQFIFMAFDDGYYPSVANIVYKKLIAEAVNKIQQPESSKLRINYIIAKIQYLISFYHYRINLYEGLRIIYKKQGNIKKVNQTYIRELKQAYDDLDIIYQEYKIWQVEKQQLNTALALYENAKIKWQQRIQANMDEHQFIREIEDCVPFDSVLFLKAVEGLKTEKQKLWYLRRACLAKHQLACQYLQKLQFIHSQSEQIVLSAYKTIMSFAPEIQMQYLKFLVRRINKHYLQQVQQQYSQTWPDKVRFFRDQIKQLIMKKRLTPKTQESIREIFYTFWVDVETSLIKDKESICQIFQTYLKFNHSVSIYKKYSKCMIRLGFLKDAKQILKRSCKAFKYDFEAIKEYQSFLAIYGGIQDLVQFRKNKIQENKSERNKEEEDSKSNKNHVSSKNNIDDYKNHSDHLATNHRQNSVFNCENFDKMQPQLYKSSSPEKIVQKATNSKEHIHSEQKPLQQELKDGIQSNKRQRNFEEAQKQEENSQPRKRIHTDSGCTLFLKGIHQNWEQQQVRNLFKYKQKIIQVRFVHKNQKRQNYCYVEMDSEETVQKQCQENPHRNQLYIAKSRPSQSDKEERNLFLVGLPYSANQQKIREMFGEYSDQILEIRLKNDDPQKCYAYVQFSSKEKKRQILYKMQKKRLQIDNKNVIIKESNSHKSKNKEVILKNISFKADEKDIRNFFSQLNIVEVNIPKTSQKKSRGFAFVKFSQEEDLKAALSIKSGMIKGRQFTIQKSEKNINRNKSSPKEQVQNPKGNDYFSNLFK